MNEINNGLTVQLNQNDLFSPAERFDFMNIIMNIHKTTSSGFQPKRKRSPVEAPRGAWILIHLSLPGRVLRINSSMEWTKASRSSRRLMGGKWVMDIWA